MQEPLDIPLLTEDRRDLKEDRRDISQPGDLRDDFRLADVTLRTGERRRDFELADPTGDRPRDLPLSAITLRGVTLFLRGAALGDDSRDLDLLLLPMEDLCD